VSVGAGIIWSTLIVLLAVAIWRTTVNKKWKAVGKVLAVIIGLGVLIGTAWWGWEEYQNRPQVVESLGGVSVGMTDVEVTLALGKPGEDSGPRTSEKVGQWKVFVYTKEHDDDYYLLVRFDGVNGVFTVDMICEEKGYSSLLGFSRYSSEQALVDKLGQPEKVSITASGLEKMISYPKWKAVFRIEKGEVTGVCTSKDGTVEFAEEYGETVPEPTNSPAS